MTANRAISTLIIGAAYSEEGKLGVVFLLPPLILPLLIDIFIII